MRSARLTSIFLIIGAIAAGLAVQAADDGPAADVTAAEEALVEPGVAMPTARGEPTLASTWYCAGGTGGQGSRADHGLIIANPTDRARKATVTALSGDIAPSPEIIDPATGEADPNATTTTQAPTTTAAPTTTVPIPPPAETTLDLPPRSRVEYRLGDLVDAKLVGAVVEIDGGEVAVEHEISGDLGRTTAPCSTTASASWSFPWGVTRRGSRELLVFMNPFPDDATLDITFATDDQIRETGRFQGFVVPGRSVVGAYVEDLGYRDQVSTQIEVRSGRLVVDRIQMFEGTDDDARRGITLGLGAPAPALQWVFPDGEHTEGVSEQIVVFNPGEEVAEVEVEVRLADPDAEFLPEPFALTVLPGRYSLVDIPDAQQPDRVPADTGHSFFVRSLNGAPVTAERVVAAVSPADRRGIGATLGSPFGSRRWIFPGGGTKDGRDEWITLVNISDDEVTFSVTSPSRGQLIPIQELQDLTLAPGARRAIRLGDHIERQDLPIVVSASGAVVAERGIYALEGRGMSQSMGIPFADSVVVPETLGD